MRCGALASRAGKSASAAAKDRSVAAPEGSLPCRCGLIPARPSTTASTRRGTARLPFVPSARSFMRASVNHSHRAFLDPRQGRRAGREDGGAEAGPPYWDAELPSRCASDTDRKHAVAITLQRVPNGSDFTAQEPSFDLRLHPHFRRINLYHSENGGLHRRSLLAQCAASAPTD